MQIINSNTFNLRNFDAYAKTLDDFRIKTSSGALITISTILVICVLVFGEFIDFMNVELKTKLQINTNRQDVLPINLNITFHHIPCYLLTLESLQNDSSNEIALKQDIYKTRLDKDGNQIHTNPARLGDDSNKIVSKVKQSTNNNNHLSKKCMSCYGAEETKDSCCNTCKEVKDAYSKKGWRISSFDKIEQCKGLDNEEDGLQKHEGCNIHGHLKVKRIGGSFHITLGKSFDMMGMHFSTLYVGKDSDYSHTIHHLSFGSDIPGVKNELDNKKIIHKLGPAGIQYFLNVVSAKIVEGSKETLTNQYTVTQYDEEYTVSNNVLPGIYFKFEISPMLIVYTKHSKSVFQLLSAILGIIGGVFTVAGIIDSFVYSAQRQTQKKKELGKLK